MLTIANANDNTIKITMNNRIKNSKDNGISKIHVLDSIFATTLLMKGSYFMALPCYVSGLTNAKQDISEKKTQDQSTIT